MLLRLYDDSTPLHHPPPPPPAISDPTEESATGDHSLSVVPEGIEGE